MNGPSLNPLYHAMRRKAAQLLGRQRLSHTLPPTALVHEAFLKLNAVGLDAYADENHVLAVAVRAMRGVLVDHARRRNAVKRQGDAKREPLDEMVLAFEDGAFNLIDLDSSLNKLAEIEPRLVEIVELRFFAGWSVQQIAEHFEVSSRTIQRDWLIARAWLRRELG